MTELNYKTLERELNKKYSELLAKSLEDDFEKWTSHTTSGMDGNITDYTSPVYTTRTSTYYFTRVGGTFRCNSSGNSIWELKFSWWPYTDVRNRIRMGFKVLYENLKHRQFLKKLSLQEKVLK